MPFSAPAQNGFYMISQPNLHGCYKIGQNAHMAIVSGFAILYSWKLGPFLSNYAIVSESLYILVCVDTCGQTDDYEKALGCFHI